MVTTPHAIMPTSQAAVNRSAPVIPRHPKPSQQEQPMATDLTDREMSHFSMTNANATMIREMLRYLVEEGLMEGARAGQIVREAADEEFAPEHSSGSAYDAGRAYLLGLARAFADFPPYPGKPGGGGSLRRDRG
jgi:hypothetical protein